MKFQRVVLACLLASGPAMAAISTEAWYSVPDQHGVQVIHVLCGATMFDPNEIVVKRGMPVLLMVRTTAGSRRFVSPFVTRGVGQAATAQSFTPGSSGSFRLSCDGDSGAGRSGQLHVVD